MINFSMNGTELYKYLLKVGKKKISRISQFARLVLSWFVVRTLSFWLSQMDFLTIAIKARVYYITDVKSLIWPKI